MRLKFNPNRFPAEISPEASGLQALRRVVDSGLLQCGLPLTLGGLPGKLEDLLEGAADLARADAPAAWVLWAQRMAIEVLLRSHNIALREYLLPDLVCGNRAGSMPLLTGLRPVIGKHTNRGWHLSGELDWVPNLQWLDCSIAVPVALGDVGTGWAMLRSEENGLQIQRMSTTAAKLPICCGHVRLQGVFFREDEWLGDSSLTTELASLHQLLMPVLNQIR